MQTNYVNYFNLIINKLNKGGIILADNVLWSGKVIDLSDNDLTTRILREFNELVTKILGLKLFYFLFEMGFL